MRITEIEAMVLAGSGEQGIYGAPYGAVVRVSTDEGITGWGEADSHPEIVRAAVEAAYHNELMSGLAPLLIGQDPCDPPARWADMARGTVNFARDGVTVEAMAAIDIALWDIAGKAANKPVHALLGERKRTDFDFYATHPLGSTLEETARFAAMLRDQGMPGVKFGWHPLGLSPEGDRDILRTLRDTLGPDIHLLIDGGMAFTPETGIERSRMFAEHDVFWFEEVLRPYDIEGYRRLAAGSAVRICAGEMAATRDELARLAENACVHVLQIDVARVGITRGREVAALANACGIPAVNHTYSLDLNLAASLHLFSTVADVSLFELQVTPNEIRDRLVTNRPRPADGRIAVPEGPGLGVTVDEDALARFVVAG